MGALAAVDALAAEVVRAASEEELHGMLGLAPATSEELVELVLHAFADMGASPASLHESRLRLIYDPAFYEEWVVRIEEWHENPMEHLQVLRDSGLMAKLLGPDLEIE